MNAILFCFLIFTHNKLFLIVKRNFIKVECHYKFSHIFGDLLLLICYVKQLINVKVHLRILSGLFELLAT